jgi:hypothetical protein
LDKIETFEQAAVSANILKIKILQAAIWCKFQLIFFSRAFTGTPSKWHIFYTED